MGIIISIYTAMVRNKQEDIHSAISTTPVSRDAGSVVMVYIRPVDQCLPKIYMKFSIMNNNHHENSLFKCWQVSALPPHRSTWASKKGRQVKALGKVKVADHVFM